MAAKHISQSDARWYKRRAEDAERTLKNQKSRWAEEFSPGWVNIETLCLSSAEFAAVSTARLLGHAVIVVPEDKGTNVRLYAEPLT
jgi:hypothetical protein